MAQPSHRNQLLRGAIECLKTKGYANTTARDVAAAADANLASIGYHFGSKEALLNEALIELFRQRNRRVGERMFADAGGDSTDQLRKMFVAVNDVFAAPRPLFISFVEAVAQAARSPELREQLASHYRDARRAMASSLRELLGENDSDDDGDAEVTAALLMATFDGLVLQWLLDPESVPDGNRLLDALLHTVSVVLSNSPPTSTTQGGRRPAARRGSRSKVASDA
jgi:AcrR family transcriptional regulator